MHTDSPVKKKKQPLFNCESGPAGSHPQFRRGLYIRWQHTPGMEALQGAECLFGSRSFVSPSRTILRVNRNSSRGETESRVRTDRWVCAGGRTHARTRTRSRNFPKHFPANNKQQLFFTSVSRRWIEIRGALSSSHLLSCFRTRSENVTFPDFPYFHPHVTSRAGTHSVLLEPFPIWHVQYGLYVIFFCLSSEMFTFMTPFFHTNSFEPLKEIGGFHFLARIFI